MGKYYGIGNYRSVSSLTNDYCGQNDKLYYQPKPPANYNQRQKYLHHRTKKTISLNNGL